MTERPSRTARQTGRAAGHDPDEENLEHRTARSAGGGVGIAVSEASNIRIQATAGAARCSHPDARRAPAAPDPARSPHRGMTELSMDTEACAASGAARLSLSPSSALVGPDLFGHRLDYDDGSQ